MNTIKYVVMLLLVSVQLLAQHKKSDANLIGHVVTSENEHIPFATILLKGTTTGTTTDETGHFNFVNLKEGKYVVVAKFLGYAPQEKEVVIKRNTTAELKFTLSEDVLGLKELVITGDRNEMFRTDASTIVTTITPKLFTTTQSVTLSEGLNFCPGLRMENNCQNCGFSQVRMNGMEGPYSQILINSRAIFSGLAGVYGLELIPSNMIERVEIIRGGGSALYGSNAIAGTINLILKDPINNTFEAGYNHGFVGVGAGDDLTNDISANFNTSIVTADHRTGMSLYGFIRNRGNYDANGDSFSEISTMKNVTLGARLFHKFSGRDKLSADVFHINEDRRGGNDFAQPLHMAGIAEAVEHNISTVALTYEKFMRDEDVMSVYVSGQNVERSSFYGANESGDAQGAVDNLSNYGATDNLTMVSGVQYNAKWLRSSLVAGVENTYSDLVDKKLAHVSGGAITPNTIVSDQTSNTLGVFAQYEYRWKNFKASLGARYEYYDIKDNAHNSNSKENGDVDGNVISPRVTLKYDINKDLQLRTSYSQGYRAPQIFDEDLHIETSQARTVIHRNADNLVQEMSHSYMASADYNKQVGGVAFGVLLEGFYTVLDNPFVVDFGEPDANRIVTAMRKNAEQGSVKGINIELNLVPSKVLSFTGGWTFQNSAYTEAQDFDEKRFFRTPNSYGFLTADYNPTKQFGLSLTGNYTGEMLVPYFGNTLADPDAGELRTSSSFLDLGFKTDYTVKINGASLQVFAGMKNIFNSYQSDFDFGGDRDPAYIYGPLQPRTVYAGIKIGNFL